MIVGRKRLVFVVLLAGLWLPACGAESPLSPVSPRIQSEPELLTAAYSFSCGEWDSRGEPPVRRTYFDVSVPQNSDGSGPSAAALDALKGAGGSIMYSFHVSLVRVVLNVAAIPALSNAQMLSSARVVTNLSSYSISLVVMVDHKWTDADTQAVTALGGTVTSAFSFSSTAAVRIDDQRVAALRAQLPGVLFVEYNGVGCLTSPDP